MASAEFYIHRDFAPRAEVAQSGTFLFGGYTVWSSFGDYLQLKATLESHEQIGAHEILYVLMRCDDRAAYERNVIAPCGIAKRVVPIYFHPDHTGPDVNGSDELVPLPHAPSRSLIHVFGSAFANESWGHAVRHSISRLIDSHARDNIDGEMRLFMSGVQLSTGAEADAWRHFFARAGYVGARDAATVALLRRQQKEGTAKVQYSGDDALLALAAALTGGTGGESVSALATHINSIHHSAYDADRRLDRVAAVIGASARYFPAGATCDLLIADSTAHWTEHEAVQQLEARYLRLADAGAVPRLTFRFKNIFEEAVDGSLCFGASFLVASSYHVALMGLLSGCPTLLMADNDDHPRMGSGLVDGFKTERFTVVGNDDDASRAAAALLEEVERSRPPATGVCQMWMGQADKALKLSRICLDQERAAARNRLELTGRAFQEVAASLGELRKRRILEEKLARERADQTAITLTIPATAGLTKYLGTSYWKRRRAAWVRSIKKRISKWG